MPEGPEIRLAADRVAKALEGQRVEELQFAFDDLRAFARRLRGRLVRAVETRGKAMLVRFENGWNVYSHNQLYGRWYVEKRGSLPDTTRQLRLALHTVTRSALLYSASDIEVLRDRELADHPFLRRLGPDILDRSLRRRDVVERLQHSQFRRRSVAALLLDQGFLCGLGNYLRSEILFLAGIDPRRRPADLHDFEIRALAEATLTLSRRAYRTRGITNEPDIVRQLKQDGVPRHDYRFFVFGRDGQRCRQCGTEIAKGDAGSRRIYTCPVCQPESRLD